jgi:hypothetical protein
MARVIGALILQESNMPNDAATSSCLMRELVKSSQFRIQALPATRKGYPDAQNVTGQ